MIGPPRKIAVVHDFLYCYAGVSNPITKTFLGLGLLFAPRSGEETREYLADTARDGLDGAVAQGQKWTRRAQRAASHAREQVEAAADAGERAFDQAAGRG